MVTTIRSGRSNSSNCGLGSVEAPNGSAQNWIPKMNRSANANTSDQPTKPDIVGKLPNLAKGASLDEIARATGSHHHICRVFFTGLLKKGRSIRAKWKGNSTYNRIFEKYGPDGGDAMAAYKVSVDLSKLSDVELQLYGYLCCRVAGKELEMPMEPHLRRILEQVGKIVEAECNIG